MQQANQQDEVQDGALETLWAGAGGLQGYSPLTKPLGQQVEQNQQDDDEVAVSDNSDLQQQGPFYFLASLFFEERDKQQMEQLQRPLQELDLVVAPLSAALHFFRGLEEKTRRLRLSREKLLQSSSGLQGALKHLLQRQAQAEALSQCIEQRLRHYTQLEYLTQQLRNPPVVAGGGLGSRQAVEVSAIRKVLNQIEEALQFFASHLNYRDAEANLCAYEVLRTRSLSILLSAALQHMRHTEELLLTRLREKQQQQEAPDDEGLDLSVLHVQFEVLMAATRPVMQILREKQSLGLSDAYTRTLQHLGEEYCAMRLRLVLPALKRQLQHLLRTSDTLPQASRAVASTALSVFGLESRLFDSFSVSSHHEGALRTLLEGLATATYDELCPAVLACNSVEDLCDIRETLLLEMVAGQTSSGDAMPLLQKLLQLIIDVQERLFYRLDVTVEEEITRFILGPQHLTREWLLRETYPPVRHALHLVLLLQQRSTRETGDGAFGSLAGDPFDAACSDVVGACLSSLEAASRTVSAARISFFVSPSQTGPTGELSNVEVSLTVCLFLIKNLTLLQCHQACSLCPFVWCLLSDVLSSYESRFVRSERKLAFTGVAGSFFQLLRLGGAAAADRQGAETQAAAGVAAVTDGAASPSWGVTIPDEGGFFFSLLPRVSEITYNATAAVHAALAAACRDFVAAAVALLCVDADELLASAHSLFDSPSLLRGSPERAAAIRALPSMHEDALRERLRAFELAGRTLLPPLVGLLLPSLTPELFSEDGPFVFGEGERATQLSEEEEALLNVDFLLKPVMDGLLSKIREVDDLLVKEAQLDEETLKAVGWGRAHPQAAEKFLRASIRSAAAAAFAEAKERTDVVTGQTRLEAPHETEEKESREPEGDKDM